MATRPAELFEDALTLFRSGEDLAALETARTLLEVCPGHVGGTMLFLAASGACCDDLAIELALRTLLGRLDQLLAIPEVVELLDSDLIAPVVRSRAFRESVAPALGRARRRPGSSAERETARQVLEAVRDASVERALFSAPGFRPAPAAGAGPGALQLLDRATGRVVAVLQPGRLYVGGRASVADIQLNDPSVSRLHFNVRTIENTWVVQNASRTNGTDLNDQPLSGGWTPIQDGDSLQVGDVWLEAVATRSAERDPPAPALAIPEPPAEETTSLGLPRHALPAGPEPEADHLQTAPRPILRTAPTSA